jgi:hypothetical protein
LHPKQARLLLEFTRKNAGGVYDWRNTKVKDEERRRDPIAMPCLISRVSDPAPFLDPPF